MIRGKFVEKFPRPVEVPPQVSLAKRRLTNRGRLAMCRYLDMSMASTSTPSVVNVVKLVQFPTDSANDSENVLRGTEHVT